MRLFYVYQYYDPIRKEPIYIGSGQGKRINFHLSRKDNHPLTNRIIWMRKWGKEPIVTKLYENLDYYDAFTIEPFVIKEIGRKKLKKGPLLNLTEGGEGITGWHHSNKTKSKMKKRMSGKNNPIFGKPRSETTKKLIGKLAKERLSNPQNNPMFGKKHSKKTKNKIKLKASCRIISKETKLKMSMRRKGKPNKSTEKLKKFYNIKFPDGHIEKIFGLREFCRNNGIFSSNILQHWQTRGYSILK